MHAGDGRLVWALGAVGALRRGKLEAAGVDLGLRLAGGLERVGPSPLLRREMATPGQGGRTVSGVYLGSGTSSDGPVHWMPRRAISGRRARPRA